MNISHSTAPLRIMHVDLNSCFATIEQQSRPTLRGRPVGVTNRRSKNAAIITASYEAKQCGIETGMRVYDAKKLCPDIAIVESDPPKYRFVYHELLRILQQYSPTVQMKSIDEGVIDFNDATIEMQARSMFDVGEEIKAALRRNVGCVMRCNIGISTNRFLAKTAAGLNKPDGMDYIDATTVMSTLEQLSLRDLTGIGRSNAGRLESVGIHTPVQFYNAQKEVLKDMVFKSVCGEQWYMRLRGYEVDDAPQVMKSVGRQYVCEGAHLSRMEVGERLHHLVESVGGKLRSGAVTARGIGVYVRGYDGEKWQRTMSTALPFYSNEAIWSLAGELFRQAPHEAVREIGVWCYLLEDDTRNQTVLFGDTLAVQTSYSDVIDAINDRYGERTIHSASTLGTEEYMASKVPFGSTRYL